MTVLTPATAGARVRLTFSAFNTENCCDYLEVRDGALATSPIIGTYRGTTIPNAVAATNATGQLRLLFHSDGSVTSDGFAAAISCIINPTTITSFTPTSGPAGTTVVLTGTFFTGATSVLFNGTPATTYTVNSATQITVTVPANALSGPISVITPTGGVGVSTGIFNTGNFVIGTNANTCSAVLFDSGGPNGNYQNNETLTSVLTPSTPGAKVQLTFTTFNTATNDEVRIYDGPTANAPLLGTFSGTTNPGTITATTFAGELTVVFFSNGFTTAAGFAATISCTAPVPCAPVTALTATSVTQTTATLNFTAGVGNNSYVVTLTPAGGGPAITVTPAPTASPVLVTGLTPGLNYTASVTPTCTTGNAPAVTTTLRTLLANDDPAGAITIPITTNCTTPTVGDNTTATTTNSTPLGYFNPGCGFASLPKDVWYQFTTAATGATAMGVQINVTGNPAGQVRVFSSAGATGPFNQIACSTSGMNDTVAPNFAVGSLMPSTTYYLSVSGYGSNDSTGPFTLCLTTPAATPAITGLTAGTVTTTSATFSFTAPTPAPTSYTVTYTNAAGQTVTATPAPTGSPFTLSGLTAGTTYTVTVVANYANGVTSTPTTATFTTMQGSATRAALGDGLLSVFPNPAQQHFTLRLPAVAGARTAQLTLVNALGQTVLTQTTALQADGTQVVVDVPGLATGLYTLRVRAGSQSATTKVAISR